MKLVILLISSVASLGFGYLLIDSFSLPSLLAFLTSLITFLSSIVSMRKKTINNENKGNTQTIGNNSTGVQIGGNVTINSKIEEI